jgi:three-Cys-motif partner protein
MAQISLEWSVMTSTRRFFEKVKDHSEIKHRILGKFIRPWRSKLGFKVRNRPAARLWYVDAFAGTGKYGDGADGSPVLGAREALRTQTERRGYQLSCINVELEKGRCKQLESNTSEFTTSGVTIHNICDDFSAAVPQILNIVGSANPVLLFVDPFGIKPLIFEALAKLLSRSGEVDLILTFNTSALHRLVVDHPDLVTKAIGSSDWTKEWNIRGRDAVLDSFSQQLVRAGRFLPIASHPVRAEEHGPIHYHLLIGSRHEDAYVLSNDSVCKENERLSGYKTVLQPSLLASLDKEQEERELLDLILQVGRSMNKASRKSVRNHLVINHWGKWHTSDINRAVTALVASGLAAREYSGDIDTDPLTFQ